MFIGAVATAGELDSVLQNFFAELKKKDGTDYEPESLCTMLAALDRHFRSSGFKHSIRTKSLLRAGRY